MLEYSLRIIILLLIILMGEYAMSQYAIEAHAHRGFLLPHRQNMLHLPQGPAHAAEIRLIKKTNHSKAWHTLYNNPDVGITIRGFDLANRNLLGYGLALGGFFSSPVVSTKRFQWSLEMGAGLGYTTKKFDFDDNYKNIAIGSDINAYILLGQKFSYALSKRLVVSTALGFNHLSNAAFALPNLGLNYPMISLGMQTVVSPSDDNLALKLDTFKLKGYWDISTSVGVKETYDPRKTKFATYNISFQRVFAMSRKSSLSSGFDVFYNSALYALRTARGETISTLQNLQSGVRVGYQMHIDELIVSLHLGVYVLDSYKGDGFMYHRAGMRYYLTKHWGVNLSLKTHFFKADYFELGAAYRF